MSSSNILNQYQNNINYTTTNTNNSLNNSTVYNVSQSCTVQVYRNSNLNQIFSLNSSDSEQYARVTDDFVTNHIRETGYYNAYEYMVIFDDIIVNPYKVMFVNVNDLSQFGIAANIDGDIKGTICNVLYCTSIGSIGNYVSDFEYVWSVYWNNNELYLETVNPFSDDLCLI